MAANISNLQERNQQVLKNISDLQTQEKELYNSLDNASLSTEEKQQIINKINEISQMRINMYSTINNMYSFIQEDIASSRTTLGQQIAAIDILEDQLNKSKIKMNLLQDQKNNKLRLVEINTYYGKRYNSHSNLMKLIVITCVPIIILTILVNGGILPSNIYSFFIGLILIISVILIGSKLIDMSNRSNMNWDEYDWYFDKNNAPSPDFTGTSTSGSGDPWTTVSATCVGSACCYDDSTYDSEKNICVPNNLYKSDANTNTNNTNNTDNNNTNNNNTNSDEQETIRELGKYGYQSIKSSQLNQNVSPMFSSLSKF